MKKIDKKFWKISLRTSAYFKEQIETFIIESINHGILKPNDQLPAYRKVAALNNVHRNAVLRAYLKLQSQGWLSSKPGVGTFVTIGFPNQKIPDRFSKAVEKLPVKLQRTKRIELISSQILQSFTTIGFDIPSPQYFPTGQYFSSMNKHRKFYRNCNQMDQVVDLQGTEFKAVILKYLNTSSRAFGINSDCLTVFMGRTEALDYVIKTLLKPCEVIINTSTEDIALLNILEGRGVQSYRLNILDLDFVQKLEDLLQHTTIKALYLRPQCSYPESHHLSTETCMQLLELAKKHRFYIVEEDDYHEFWHKKGRFNPLICYDHHGHVIYLGALSLLSPYLQNTRTVIAAAEFISAMQQTPVSPCQFRDILIEKSLTDLINSGKLWECVHKVSFEMKEHVYQAFTIAKNYLAKDIKINKPGSGLSLWLKFPNDTSLQKSRQLMLDMGFQIPYHPHGQMPVPGVYNIRLGFGSWDLKEIEAPAKILQEWFKLGLSK